MSTLMQNDFSKDIGQNTTNMSYSEDLLNKYCIIVL